MIARGCREARAWQGAGWKSSTNGFGASDTAFNFNIHCHFDNDSFIYLHLRMYYVFAVKIL